jgi:hypothetical protein
MSTLVSSQLLSLDIALHFHSICVSLASDFCVSLCVCGGESDSQWRLTPLFWAAQRGDADCVRLLLDAGANTEAEDKVRVDR